MGSDVSLILAFFYALEEDPWMSSIPEEEWRTGWVNGKPRRRCCYVTWAQVLKHHNPEEIKELAEYLFGCDGIAMQGEQTACFLAYDYLLWLKAKEKDNVGIDTESEHANGRDSRIDRCSSCSDGDSGAAQAAQEDRSGVGDNEPSRCQDDGSAVSIG